MIIIVCFLNYHRGFQLFPFEYYVGCRFVMNGFYAIEIRSHHTHLGGNFILNGVEFYQMFFFCIYGDNHLFFVFPFVNQLYCLIAYVEPFLQPWDDSNLIIVYDPFYVCRIQFADIFLEIFASVFIKDIDL